MSISALSSSLSAMHRANGQLQDAADRTLAGDLEGGALKTIEARTVHKAALAVAKTEDERLQELVDLL